MADGCATRRSPALLVGALAMAGALSPAAGRAQVLVPKRVLTVPSASQCAGVALPSSARRDAAGARQEAARARELALTGERVGARAAFQRAVALDPADPQLVYDLARVAEETDDRATAANALCRYLLLAPTGREAGEARSRLARVAPPTIAPRDAAARETFARGVERLEALRFADAAAAFDEVLRQVPSAPEAVYDRGLARLGLGQESAAAADLAAYVASPGAGSDRAQVLRAVEALRQPNWSVGGAFARGIVPGLGQIYTARPVLGLTILAGAAGGMAAAFVQRETRVEETFRDQFGNPYTSTVVKTDRPYTGVGLAVAGTLALGGAIEAAYYASSHRRDRPRLQMRTAAGAAPRVGGGIGPTLLAGATLRF